MPKTRKSATRTMNDASVRLAGIKSIDQKIDFQNGISASIYANKINEVETAMEEYNTALAMADEKLNTFTAAELELREMNERVLISVAAKYGKDSDEYEKAGGTRKSERKRPAKKTTVKS
ncbi:MAG: hypothetical protein H7Z37_07310 [Pyrinomonadaceae bacterium]|nr:hypothetical protein [Pyrinomonadaceae bacterium]